MVVEEVKKSGLAVVVVPVSCWIEMELTKNLENQDICL
jgi:hypothetical protein